MPIVDFDSSIITSLIQLLKLRGMVIKNEDFAKEILSKINYYRLSDYWFKYQNKWVNKNVDFKSQQEKEDFEKLITGYANILLNPPLYSKRLKIFNIK